MPRFEIRSGDAAHEVDAANWMAALGEGLGQFGLSQESLSKVICDLDEAGLITVKDPESGQVFTIQEAKGAAAVQMGGDATHEEPKSQPAVRPRLAQSLDISLSLDMDADDAPDPRRSPAFETVSDRSADALEALIADCARIGEASDATAAAEEALTVAMRTVPAESGAVLLIGPDRKDLVFVAAKGPASRKVLGMRIPADAGIAGLSVRSRTAMLVREVSRDPRHDDRVNEKSGYTTHALLVVPLRGAVGVHGCLELLNPFGVSEFEEWHLEAAQLVGAKLAARLG
jgi:hypothetical protein